MHPPIDPHIREKLKAELQNVGVSALYQRLQEVDPEFAGRISDKDPQRILRGLEIYIGTGMNITEHWRLQKRVLKYHTLRILISPIRAVLYERINQRAEQMLSCGLLSEIEALLHNGYTWQDPGLATLGYKEFKDFFQGKSDLADCTELVAQHHRNYAKRQLTWYRKCRFDLTIGLQSFSLSDVLGEIESRYMRYKEETGAHHSQDS
jgi:tRNA dimethylallyltransferase